MISRVKTEQSSEKGLEDYALAGVTFDDEKCLIQVSFQDAAHEGAALRSLWARAGEVHLSMMAPLFSEQEARFFSDRESQKEWSRYLEDLKSRGIIQNYQIREEVVPLSVVGDRFSDSMALYEVMQILAHEKIPVFSGTVSALSMTLGVPLEKAEQGVKVLHQQLLKG